MICVLGEGWGDTPSHGRDFFQNLQFRAFKNEFLRELNVVRIHSEELSKVIN